MDSTVSSQEFRNVPSYRQTTLNVLSIWVSKFIGIVTPIIITPIITHGLGLDLVGVWLMITQMTSHLMLLDGGFVNSIVRFLSNKRALKDTDGASQYIATAFYVLLIVSCLLMLCSPLIGHFFLKSLHISKNYISNVNSLLFIAIIYVSMSLPMRIGYGLLSSVHRFDRIQLFDSIFTILKLVMIFLLFRFGTPSLPYMGLIVFGTSLMGFANIFADGLRRNKDLSLSPTFISRSALKDLTSMGGAALFVTCASILLMQSSAMITGYILGPASVALISYPLMIYTSLTPFTQVISLLITPVAAAMSATKEEEGMMGSLVMLSVKYHSAASFLILLMLISIANPFLELWLSGPKIKITDIQSMSSCLIILFTGYVFSSVGQVGRSVLTSCGFHWKVAVAELCTSIFALVFIYYLIKYFNFGVIGTATGIASIFIIRGIIIYPIMLRQIINDSPIIIVIKSIGIPLIIFLIAGSVGFSLQYILDGYHVNKYIIISFSCVIKFFIWLLATWFFLISPPQRIYIMNKIKINIKR